MLLCIKKVDRAEREKNDPLTSQGYSLLYIYGYLEIFRLFGYIIKQGILY